MITDLQNIKFKKAIFLFAKEAEERGVKIKPPVKMMEGDVVYDLFGDKQHVGWVVKTITYKKDISTKEEVKKCFYSLVYVFYFKRMEFRCYDQFHEESLIFDYYPFIQNNIKIRKSTIFLCKIILGIKLFFNFLRK
jgi:hypothetical protein